MIKAVITFDEFTDHEDARRAIRSLNKLLEIIHHPAQIEIAQIDSTQIIGPNAEIIDAEFTVVKIQEV